MVMPRVSDMKNRLMDAAMDLMWQNSYGAASVDAICERAGAKKGSFYYFFKSKSELAAAALEADWNKKKAEMDSMFLTDRSPTQRLGSLLRFCLQSPGGSFKKNVAPSWGVRFVSVGSEVSTQDQIVREAIDRIMDRKLQFFVSAVRDAAARGVDRRARPTGESEGPVCLLPGNSGAGADPK